jgi:enoyl-CoA hydratase
MAYSTIIYEKKGRIAKITLNRPEVLNAVNSVMNDELCQAIDEVAKDPEIDVMILTGAGRGFCAGRDLKEVLRFDQGSRARIGIMERIRKLPFPTICAVNGPAVTGGMELAIACDIIIASEKAVFADTHARAGLVPGGGMSQILPRLVGLNRAKELSFTGRYVPAQEAYQIGLVNRVVPHDQLMAAAESMARDILDCNQKALRKAKSLIEKGQTLGLEAGFGLEALEMLRWRDQQREMSPEEADKVRERVLQKGRAEQKK